MPAFRCLCGKSTTKLGFVIETEPGYSRILCSKECYEKYKYKYRIVVAKEILERAERIPYNPKWTLLEQNQLQAAKNLAKEILSEDG